jgi:hypothetical protein
MRVILILVGVALLGLGAAAALGKFDYRQEQEVFKLGELSAKVQQEKTVPPWIGYLGIGAGVVLLGLAAIKRN